MLQLKRNRWAAGSLALCVLGAVFLRAPVLAEDKPQSTSAKEMQILIRQLGDDEFAVREKAKKRLSRIGMPAVKALREAVGSAKDLEVQRRAKALLEKIDPHGVRRAELEARRAALRKAIEKVPGVDVKNWAETIANPFRELTEEGKKRLTAVGIDVTRLQKMHARYLSGKYCGANSVEFVNTDEDTILVVGDAFCTHGGVYSAGPVLAVENAYFMDRVRVANLLWFVDRAGASDAVLAAPAIAADGAGIHTRHETAGILLGDYGWRRPKDLLRPPTADEAKNDPPLTKELAKARKELTERVKKARAVDVTPFAEEIANPFTALTEKGKTKLKFRGIDVDRLQKLKAVYLRGTYRSAPRKDFVNNDADTILVIGWSFLTHGDVYSLGPMLVLESAHIMGNAIGADLVWFTD